MRVRLHTDAGLRSKVRKAGVGFVIRDGPSIHDQIVRQGAIVLDEYATISEAEYSAIIFGLYNARMLGATTVDLYSDSQLCVRQINGRYRCRAKNLLPYLEEVKYEIRQFDQVVVNWIRRDSNTEADDIVRQVLEEEE